METLLKQLFQNAYRLNQTGRYAVFFNYFGHINGIQVYAYKGKWHPDKEMIIDTTIHLSEEEEDANTLINNLINELKKLYNEPPAQPQFGSIDILGRAHKTVIVGSQEWMAVNLFCPELGWHYDGNPKNSEGGYGTHHSHFTIPAIQALLPDDWRVPTDDDWDKLIDTIGEDAGRKLKSKDDWVEDGNGADEFGFRVLPAGYRNTNGSHFFSRGHNAWFWSSSAHNASIAWYRRFNYGLATVYRNYDSRSYGFSVRCVRDLK